MEYILGIESSCDETSVAVVADGRKILSNVISTQIETHKQFGGVVPEIASRMHTEAINTVYKQAIFESGISLIEWPDNFMEYLPEDKIIIKITRLSENERMICVEDF